MEYVKQFFIEIYDFYLLLAPYFMLGLFTVGVLNFFLDVSTIKKYFAGGGIIPILNAALLGVPMPLCSCSVLPTAKFFDKNGASKGAVTSFLISAPITGMDSIILTIASMGFVFGIYRPIVALIMGILGGLLIGFISGEKKTHVPPIKQEDSFTHKKSLKEKLYDLYRYPFVEFLDDMSTNFGLGILISAFILIFIPDSVFQNFIVSNYFVAYFLILLISLPMYICATASIPVGLTLLLKGVSPGAVFVLLTAGPVSNLASWIIVNDILGKKNFFAYLIFIIAFSVAAGALLDYMNWYFNLDIAAIAKTKYIKVSTDGNTIINYVCGIVLGVLLLFSFYRQIRANITHSHNHEHH